MKKRLLILLVIALILCTGRAFAYFLFSDEISNVFTVGNISIELTETAWDENDAISLTPNKTVEKNPVITNNGANQAYCFMKVKMPKKSLATANQDGSLNAEAVVDLFSFDLNEGWKLIKTDETGSDDNIYIYAYASNEGDMTILEEEDSTPALFDEMTFVNAVEGTENITGSVDITAYGIQTEDLGVTAPEDIWNIVFNQNSN